MWPMTYANNVGANTESEASFCWDFCDCETAWISW
jgi:hypothetical protein